jgi:hypothetical protein
VLLTLAYNHLPVATVGSQCLILLHTLRLQRTVFVIHGHKKGAQQCRAGGI